MKASLPKQDTPWHAKFVRQDERHRLLISLGVALVGFLVLSHLQMTMRAVAAWDIFTCCFLGMANLAMHFATPDQIRHNANAQDPGRHVVFAFALVASFVSLFAVVLLLHSAKGLKGLDMAVHLVLAIFAAASSWLLIQIIFAFRYAHMFYDKDDGTDAEGKPLEQAGGLDFPGDDDPDYQDFAYFSFVIGMTFQVSDVEISSRPLRRLALKHSILAFAFNTMIVALSINIISGLI